MALISFQVLLRSWIQLQKNSSNERSWVKNMGWKSWQFSLAVNKHMGQIERFVHLSNISTQSTWGKLIYQVKHQYPYHMTKQCPIFRLICTGVSRELLTLQLGLWARTFKEAHVSVFLASLSFSRGLLMHWYIRYCWERMVLPHDASLWKSLLAEQTIILKHEKHALGSQDTYTFEVNVNSRLKMAIL